MKRAIYTTATMSALIAFTGCADMGIVNPYALGDDLYHGYEQTPTATTEPIDEHIIYNSTGEERTEAYNKRIAAYNEQHKQPEVDSRDFSSIQAQYSDQATAANQSEILTTSQLLDSIDWSKVEVKEVDGLWLDGFWGSDWDRDYAERLIRFHGPMTSLSYYSPIVNAARYSGDWNIYVSNTGTYLFPRWGSFNNRLLRLGYSYSSWCHNDPFYCDYQCLDWGVRWDNWRYLRFGHSCFDSYYGCFDWGLHCGHGLYYYYDWRRYNSLFDPYHHRFGWNNMIYRPHHDKPGHREDNDRKHFYESRNNNLPSGATSERNNFTENNIGKRVSDNPNNRNRINAQARPATKESSAQQKYQTTTTRSYTRPTTASQSSISTNNNANVTRSSANRRNSAATENNIRTSNRYRTSYNNNTSSNSSTHYAQPSRSSSANVSGNRNAGSSSTYTPSNSRRTSSESYNARTSNGNYNARTSTRSSNSSYTPSRSYRSSGSSTGRTSSGSSYSNSYSNSNRSSSSYSSGSSSSYSSSSSSSYRSSGGTSSSSGRSSSGGGRTSSRR